MTFSTLPFLYLIQTVTILRATKKTHTSGLISAEQKNQITFLFIMLTLWGGIFTYLGMTGFYKNEAFLSSLPGLWITQIAILIVMVPWMASKTLRQGINAVIDHTPLHFIMAFEGLRVLALGGILKGYMGEFSRFFSLYIGIPDFLYGILTLTAAVLIYKGIWKEKSAIVVNLIGFIIIVPFGMLFINVGLPGAMHMIEESPSLVTIFELPMALAPTLVVPIFVTVNLFVAFRLIKRKRNPDTGKHGYNLHPIRST
jgi:hypothetical protein